MRQKDGTLDLLHVMEVIPNTICNSSDILRAIS